MKKNAFCILLLFAVLFGAVCALQAAPSLSVQKPPVTPNSLTGPMLDPMSTNGQWFVNATGDEEYRTHEFYDNMPDTGGGVHQWLSISGSVVAISTNAAGEIIAFDIDAWVDNDTNTGDSGQESPGSNSHGEARVAGEERYVGTLFDTKLVAEFAIEALGAVPAAFTGPYRKPPYPSWIIAENEDQKAWYCWNEQDPPGGDQAGGYYVPTWDFGDIPIGQLSSRTLKFSVSPPMNTLDPRYAVIFGSYNQSDDVLANRTTSLKISTWIDDLAADNTFQPYPEEPLRSSDVSVFHNIEDEPYDPDHKMHWPQLPDPNGWDVRACNGIDEMQKVLADDFLCTSNGPITKITFWGSFQFDEYDYGKEFHGITNIHLSLHKDIPAGEVAQWSMPVIPAEWEKDINPYSPPVGWIVEVIPEAPSLQGWYDPNHELVMPENHMNYFRYEVTIPASEAFVQEAGTIYWLDVSVKTEDGYMWGWKTSVSEHFNDDAVFADMPVTNLMQWKEMYVPPLFQESLDLAFVIDGEPPAEDEFDWGDAPDPTFPTLNVNTGACHLIVPGILIGANIDGELDGQPTSISDGDDIAGVPNDEDGITFVPLNPVPGQPGQVSVTVVGTGFLNVWIDWDGDGSWAQINDHVFVDIPLATGSHLLNYTAPATMPWGANLFTRFRYSSVPGLTYTGMAPDGEVEDHMLVTKDPPDHELGDAPDSSNSYATNMTAYPSGVVAQYPTVYGSGRPAPVGPIHWLPLTQAYLGNAVSREEEADVNPDEDLINNILPLLDQADRDGSDDTFAGIGLPALPHCRATTLTYSATWAMPVVSQMFVNVWFDWNRDGDWNDTITCLDGSVAYEWAVQDHLLPPPPGPVPALITDTTPPFLAWHPSLSATPIWMRISIAEQPWSSFPTIAGGEGPVGGYLFGETEDYYLTDYGTVDEYDFGDAPDPTYPTLQSGGGAQHYMISGFSLGSTIDFEADGQPTVDASGDGADEDGVAFTSDVKRGTNASINVTLTSGAAGGALDAWVDFDGSGTWGDVTGEQIFAATALSAGSNLLTFPVPVNAALGTNYARFRLSSTGGLSPGGSAPDGEVEDYAIEIYQPIPSPDIEITNIYFTASNDAVYVEWTARSNATYQVQSSTNLLTNVWTDVGSWLYDSANWQTNSSMPSQQYFRVTAPWAK